MLLCCISYFHQKIKINKVLSVLSRLMNGWKIIKVIKSSQ